MSERERTHKRYGVLLMEQRLLSPGGGLYDAAVVLFCVQLGTVAVSAFGVARIVLWR